MEKNIGVVGNKVLIEPIAPDERKDGLILPDTAQPDEANAVVITVGPDADKRLHPGTRVVFDTKAGTKINKDGETLYWIMRDIDLLYFFENGKAGE